MELKTKLCVVVYCDMIDVVMSIFFLSFVFGCVHPNCVEIESLLRQLYHLDVIY